MNNAKAIFPREQYLSQLRPFYHKTDIIKVVSGIRRCGKSCLMQSVIQELHAAGVPKDKIINLNLDLRLLRHVTAADQLDSLIAQRIGPNGIHYVFVDEVQNVADFEPILNRWREDRRTSIFVTGSNSYLLSGELVTKLTGRHIEFPMYTLNFQEYMQIVRFCRRMMKTLTVMFAEYIRQGGFPESLSITDTSAR